MSESHLRTAEEMADLLLLVSEVIRRRGLECSQVQVSRYREEALATVLLASDTMHPDAEDVRVDDWKPDSTEPDKRRCRWSYGTLDGLVLQALEYDPPYPFPAPDPEVQF